MLRFLPSVCTLGIGIQLALTKHAAKIPGCMTMFTFVNKSIASGLKETSGSRYFLLSWWKGLRAMQKSYTRTPKCSSHRAWDEKKSLSEKRASQAWVGGAPFILGRSRFQCRNTCQATRRVSSNGDVGQDRNGTFLGMRMPRYCSLFKRLLTHSQICDTARRRQWVLAKRGKLDFSSTWRLEYFNTQTD